MNKASIFIVLLALVTACGETQKKSEAKTISTTWDKVKEQNREKGNENVAPKVTPVLDKAQFEDFFPEKIGPYSRINITVQQPNALAAATYVSGNDFEHSLVYTLQDGNRKGSSVLQNFNLSYSQEQQGPEGTRYVHEERDGVKTIAFLQTDLGRNLIEFTYHDRFLLSLEGSEDPGQLWAYVDKENLKKLDQY